MSGYTPCGLGPCAAPAGHDGTCAQASGWDKYTDDAKDASYDAGFAAGRAAALAEQDTEEPEWEYECRIPPFDWGACTDDPRLCPRGSERRRRRKAGPWLPVERGDAS